MIAAVRLEKYSVSKHTLQNLLEGIEQSQRGYRKRLHKSLAQVAALQKIELIVATLVLASTLSFLIGAFKSVVYVLLVLLVIALTTRSNFLQNRAHKLFESSLGVILGAAQVMKPLWKVLGIKSIEAYTNPTSQQELADTISKLSSDVIGTSQKQRLLTSLESYTKTVHTIMTTKSKIVTVSPSAVLGPILLSDLQKSSHGHFPVLAKGGIPEGIVQLSDLTDIRTAKKGKSVIDVMRPHVSWAEEDMLLDELIQLFLQEKQYMVCVRNLDGDFTGIVTIADVMKHVLSIEKE